MLNFATSQQAHDTLPVAFGLMAAFDPLLPLAAKLHDEPL